MREKKDILIFFIVILAIGAVFLAYNKGKSDSIDLNIHDETKEDVFTVNLPKEGPIAIVNGEEISVSDFEALRQEIEGPHDSSHSHLTEETKNQIVNYLVERTLLEQAIVREKITVSEEDVEAQVAKFRDRFEDNEEFEKALAAQGVTIEDFRAQIIEEYPVRKYLEQELNLSSIKSTDEEIIEYYETIATGEDIPSLEEVRNQIEDMIIRQKSQVMIDQFMKEMRESADIEVFI